MQVFPDSRHGLCVWHLHQNAITRFGALKRDPTFKKTFNYCLYKCVTVVEFETNWRSMLQQYELIGEEWFTNIVQRYNTTLEKYRKASEFSCSKSVPSSALPLSGLLKHASEVYTLSLFRDFEEEFRYSIATTAKLIWKQENTEFYVVSIDEEPWSTQRVTYIHESQTVSCTCKNFEASGWLCYHCIRILHLHPVNRILEQYIKKRWTKSAKSSVWNKLENEKPEEVQYTPWRQTMARKYYNLILKSQSNEETRTLMEDGYAASVSLVDELLASLNVSNTDDASTTETSATAAPETSATAAPETNATAAYETNSAPAGTHATTTSDTSVQQATSSEPATNTATEPPMVLDPERCTTKGRNKRPRGPFVKKKKGKTAAPPTADLIWNNNSKFEIILILLMFLIKNRI
ncbi:protein FAR-RED IMPAIRED RESPONSE 1-like [Spinacia oleracea]|uniref:Protein FAR-RED IMPAIRED RESPONSE 1-like n=1 Tax=Spinacia oleracea TaxID=3562 RepID=A0ABM3RPI4_SPIOL|nr:protein FAR-RED IMPAIRED RESPONSE 1-like [Spinacia oleracea]